MKKKLGAILLIVLFFSPMIIIQGLSNKDNTKDYTHTPAGSCKVIDIESHTLSDSCK